MNDDYLWDKTGEPDPEVQDLEEILGVLRYQPKTLVLPETPIQRPRNLHALLAIAATVVLGLVAAGIWFSVKRSNVPRTETANKIEATTEPSPANAFKHESQLVKNEEQSEPTARRTPRRHLAASSRSISNKQRDREEALAAKEQLFLALRLASEKLNEARRRTQPPLSNQNRNQHKVG